MKMSFSKPVLFVDIDGVMADSVPYWVELHNQEYGTNYTKEDVTDYAWDKCRVPFKDMTKYYTKYDKVQPIAGAFKSVGVLEKCYRPIFATSGFGAHWLRWFMPKAEVIVIYDKSLLRGYALIDDNPANLDVFQGERFLLSQPWNTGRGLNDVSWQAITDFLMEAAHETVNSAR